MHAVCVVTFVLADPRAPPVPGQVKGAGALFARCQAAHTYLHVHMIMLLPPPPPPPPALGPGCKFGCCAMMGDVERVYACASAGVRAQARPCSLLHIQTSCARAGGAQRCCSFGAKHPQPARAQCTFGPCSRRQMHYHHHQRCWELYKHPACFGKLAQNLANQLRVCIVSSKRPDYDHTMIGQMRGGSPAARPGCVHLQLLWATPHAPGCVHLGRHAPGCVHLGCRAPASNALLCCSAAQRTSSCEMMSAWWGEAGRMRANSASSSSSRSSRPCACACAMPCAPGCGPCTLAGTPLGAACCA